MDVLTSLQKKFIHKFSESDFHQSFFLTGGTALSASYLHHRLSEDLGFFTEAPEEMPQVLPWIGKTAEELGLQFEIRRQSGSFIDCFFESKKGEPLRVDFAQDAPSRFEKTRLIPEFQI